MKITKLTAFKVAPRWLFLKVEIDEGIIGWGEPSLEGQANAVIGALKDMEPRILGQDPRRIERLSQRAGAAFRSVGSGTRLLGHSGQAAGRSRACDAGRRGARQDSIRPLV